MKFFIVLVIFCSSFIVKAKIIKRPTVKVKNSFVVDQLSNCYTQMIVFNFNDFIYLMCSNEGKDGYLFTSHLTVVVTVDATKMPRESKREDELWGKKIISILRNKEKNILIGSYLVEEKNNKFKPKIGVYNLTTAKVVKEYDCVEDFICSLSSYDHKKQILKLIKLKTDKTKTLDENIFKAAEMLKKKQGSEFEMKLDFVL